MGCCDRRFRALLKRNWIYRKRDWVSSVSVTMIVTLEYLSVNFL